MNFTEQQVQAIQKIINWFFKESRQNNQISIGGLAGTGKTTIVKEIVKFLNLPTNSVIFCAFTGKATLRLRLSGNRANTIHHTFYHCIKLPNKNLVKKLKNKTSIDNQIKLIVIDESSMVTTKMIDDIVSFGIPTILLGDPGQVPPVGGHSYFEDENKLDCFLTQVMRQDDKSGILTLAQMARNKQYIPLGYYGDSSFVLNFSEIMDKINIYDIILCYSNITRRKLNKMSRDLLGIKHKYPRKGDKLLCLKNNYLSILTYKDIEVSPSNGMIGYAIEDAKEIIYENIPVLQILFRPDFIEEEDGPYFTLMAFKETFDNYQSKIIEKDPFIHYLYDEKFVDNVDEIDMIDFGYAISVHKSQGSEWSSVLLLDEMRGYKREKWLYTGITRAKKSITIAKI